MPRDKFEQPQIRRRLGRAQQHPVFHNGEVGGGEPRAPFVKSSKQTARLFCRRFDGVAHGAVDYARMTVIFSHERRRFFGQRILGVEAEDVLVASRKLVQPDPDAAEKIQGAGQGKEVLLWLDELQPARRMQVAKSSGRLFNVRLEMIDRLLKLA